MSEAYDPDPVESVGVIVSDALERIEERVSRMEEKLDQLIKQILRELRTRIEV